MENTRYDIYALSDYPSDIISAYTEEEARNIANDWAVKENLKIIIIKITEQVIDIVGGDTGKLN